MSGCQKPEISRKYFATLLGVSADEVFHSCSVSDVNNTLIQGLNLVPKDVVTVINMTTLQRPVLPISPRRGKK